MHLQCIAILKAIGDHYGGFLGVDQPEEGLMERALILVKDLNLIPPFTIISD